MAADIEFNVRNGMTVGSNKHLVLDVNGALSGSDITCTTGNILSGGSDLFDLFDLSEIETLLAANSGNWNTAYGWDDHSTQNYATSAYVDHKVSTLVDSAPATLDTLNELAAALNDDANFSTTITTAIGTKWTPDNTKISNWDNVYTDVSTNSANWNESVSTIIDATDTDVSTPLAGDALVYVNGVTQKWQNKKDRAALDDMYNYANANFYSEMSYSTTAQLTGVNVWVNNSKITALFERTLTYNVNSQLTSVLTRDIQGGTIRQQLTKNLAYDVDGNVTTVTRAYSEPAQWIPTNSSSVLWLDAADSDTITKDGSNLVSEWQDKSGNDNHVVQSNAAVKPAYTASGMSGNPAIDFSADKVATINDIDMEDKMLLLAFQLDAAGLGRNQQLFASNTDNAQLRMTTTDGNDVIGYASSSPLYTNNTKSTGTVAGDTIEVICYTLGSTLRFSINGTFEDSEQSKLTGGNLLSTFNQIGTLLSNTNTSLDGKIGEFIVINSTSTADRQKAEGYLAHKWGVASKLPADHPWKSYPPVV